ncbi:MAG TPA: hypothetical protein VN742_09640 [Candidatus Binataceae bacterium]|nr:hypothetical protein [Candidatus Binataceae bacterium]
MAELIIGSKMPAQPDATLPKGDPRVQNYGGPNPETPLAASLRAKNDPARAALIEKGAAGRGDVIPLDGSDTIPASLRARDLPADGSLQRRTVSDASYPLAHDQRRQQDPQKAVGDVKALPLRHARKLNANGVRALSRRK